MELLILQLVCMPNSMVAVCTFFWVGHHIGWHGCAHQWGDSGSPYGCQCPVTMLFVWEQLCAFMYCMYIYVSHTNILVSWNCETENALAHQASVLQSDLEKSMKDNAMLFSKIGSIISFFPCKLDQLFLHIVVANFYLVSYFVFINCSKRRYIEC